MKYYLGLFRITKKSWPFLNPPPWEDIVWSTQFFRNALRFQRREAETGRVLWRTWKQWIVMNLKAPKPAKQLCWKKMENTTWYNMDVSENNGTPKSSISIGFSIINHPFWGYTHMFSRLHFVSYPTYFVHSGSIPGDLATEEGMLAKLEAEVEKVRGPCEAQKKKQWQTRHRSCCHPKDLIGGCVLRFRDQPYTPVGMGLVSSNLRSFWFDGGWSFVNSIDIQAKIPNPRFGGPGCLGVIQSHEPDSHGTRTFFFYRSMKTIRINHSWIGKYTSSSHGSLGNCFCWGDFFHRLYWWWCVLMLAEGFKPFLPDR